MIAGGKPTPSELRQNKYPFKLRHSPIAGYGAFATRRIRKGQRIIEYVGEVISEKESDRRYPDGKGDNHHTFLFELDDNKVIDASYGGNEARFINHSCQPNCEAIDEEGHIFIFARRNIQPGVELAYDYMYARSRGDGPEEEAQYPCNCGAPRCRGTIMEPRKRKRKRKSTKRQQGGARKAGRHRKR
jgi:SET domain-containing protein